MTRLWLGVLFLAVALAVALVAANYARAQVPAGPGLNVAAGATGTTAGITATLPAATGKVTYICGFSVAPGSATTAIVISITVGALATFTYSAGAPATAAGATGAIVSQTFTPCVPGAAVNTSIVVTVGALGSGGASQTVNAWGYQR